MTGLNDLSNELVLLIGQNVHAADIEAWTSTCHLFRDLAARELARHLERKRRFTSVTVGSRPTEEEDLVYHPSRHPVTILQELLEDENVEYPRNLCLGYLIDLKPMTPDDYCLGSKQSSTFSQKNKEAFEGPRRKSLTEMFERSPWEVCYSELCQGQADYVLGRWLSDPKSLSSGRLS